MLPAAALLACALLALLVCAPGAQGWSARAVPGLVSGGGSGGPLIPTVPEVVLDGKTGLSTSLQPTLRWPDAPSGQKEFEVLSLSGKSLWRIGVSSSQTRVNPGVLKQGGAYRWRATAGGRTFDGGLFRVDMQRLQVQGALEFGGISVGSVSGEAIFSWSSRQLETIGGEAGFTLSYQPSNSQLVSPQPGLPSGWKLTAGGGSPWTHLKVVSTDWVELVSETGMAIPYSRGSGGLWLPKLGEDQAWPPGSETSLSQAGDGSWTATARNGSVATFPKAQKVGDRVWATKLWRDGEPSLQQIFDSSGRLKALLDPVGGRLMKFIYKGINETDGLRCENQMVMGRKGKKRRQARGRKQGGKKRVGSFRSVPDGLLCLTSGWEQPAGQPRGSSQRPVQNRLFYMADSSGKPRLARVIGDSHAGGQLSAVTDLAYDSVGRLTKMRAPLTTRAVAAGVLKGKPAGSDPDVLTTVSYDSAGRVSRITQPAPLSRTSTGERAWRSFTWSTEGGSMTQIVRAPERAQALAVVTSTLKGMLTTRSVDQTGQATTTEWNEQFDLPSKITSPGGMVETFTYDSLGNQIEQRGPSTQVDSAGAPVRETSYDTEKVGSATEPLKGLQVIYYRNREFQGLPGGHDTGPRIGSSQTVSSLDFTWPSSPINSTVKAWSARLFGYLEVPRNGNFTFTNSPGTALWMGGQLCSPTCSLQGLSDGQMVPIQIQVVSGVNGSASVGATWAGPGASGAIPSDNLRPGYTRPSEESVNDALSQSSGTQTLETALTYSNEDPTQLVSSRSPSGKTSTRSYESYDPSVGEFGRSTGAVSAAGNSSVNTYYGQHDLVAVPSQCPVVGGQAFDQAGMPRAMKLEGNLRTGVIHDDTGAKVALFQNGRLTSCQAYDAAGNPTVSHYPAWGDSPEVTRTVSYNASGNPLLIEEEIAQDSVVRRTSGEVDILGRQVSTTDVWKTTTTFRYDFYDRPVKTVATTGTGQVSETTTSYDEGGNVKMVAIDGRQMGAFSYDSAGRLVTASYGNDSATTFRYNQNGGLASRTTTIGGQTVSESVTTSQAGRILGRTIAGPGASGSWSYAYDRDGRLTSAELAGAMPAGVTTGTWSYELNDASQRTAIVRPGTGRVEMTYGNGGEIEGTSDSRFGQPGSDQFTYDELGRATTAGPIALEYDASGEVWRLREGSTAVNYMLAAGEVIGKTISTTDAATGQKSSKSVRFSSQGLLLCPKCEVGTALSRMVPLPGGVTAQIPISRKSGPARSANTDWRYKDLQGNVTWETLGSEAPTSTAIYDPDGNQLSTEPALSTDPTNPNLRYRALQTEPLSPPIVQAGFRSYVPALGLFLQPDPVPNGGPTPYDFGYGDPINFQDDSGMMPSSWATAIKVVCGVAAGLAIASVTAGIGSVVAAAALNGLVDATAQLLAQSIILLYDVAAGEPETEFNWAEIYLAGLTGAALGGATTAIANLKPLANTSKAVLSNADEATDTTKALLGGLKDDAAEFQSKYISDAALKNQAKNAEKYGKDYMEGKFEGMNVNLQALTDQKKLQEHYFSDPNPLPDFFKPYNFGN